MNIDRLSSLLTLRPGAAATLPALRLGDELTVKVLRAEAGQALLEVGNRRLEARTSLPLAPGQTLQLRVAQLQPTLVLRLAAQVGAERTIDEALRALLPQPAARAPLGEALARLAAAPTGRLPAQAQQALAGLLTRVPSAASLGTPGGLARALAGSGLFLEARLAASPGAAAPADLKSALLQLVHGLRATRAPAAPAAAAAPQDLELAELVELAEGALSRLQLLQLHAVSSPRLDLLFELPLLFGGQLELLQLRVEEEDRGGGDESNTADAPGHQVRLGFALGEAGRLDALVRLRGERVSVLWWAEQAQTAQLLREHLPLLESRLAELGLEVQAVECLDGRPQPLDALPLLRRQGILRERA